jgi:hypothetical protein
MDPRFGPSLPYAGDEELVLFLTRGQYNPGNGHIFKLVIDLSSL